MFMTWQFSDFFVYILLFIGEVLGLFPSAILIETLCIWDNRRPRVARLHLVLRAG